MAKAFPIPDKDLEKKRGTGAILCLAEYKMKLRNNLLALPVEFI